MDYGKKLVVILLFLLGYGDAHAEYYRADSKLDYIADNGGWHIEKLNENSFIFVGKINQQKGIYRYDVLTDKAVLLKPVSVPSYATVTMWPAKNRVLIDVLGKLYITNGTAGGTHFIRDFSYFTVHHDQFSNLCKVTYMHGIFYFVVGGCQGSPGNAELWVSDGTAGDARQISNNQFLTISNVLDDHTDSGNSVLVIAKDSEERTKIWKTSGMTGRFSYVAKFPRGYEPHWPVRTSKGWFFCIFGDRPSMMRLSNGLAISEITNGCQSPVVINDEIYFSTPSYSTEPLSVWVSSGAVGNRRLVKQFGPPNPTGEHSKGGLSFCSIGKELYFNYYSDASGYQIWRSKGSAESTYRILEDTGYSLDACLADRLVIHYSTPIIDFDIWTSTSTPYFYFPASSELFQIHNTGDFFLDENTLVFDGVIYATKYLENIAAPVARYQILKITERQGNPVEYLPALLNLLMEEQVSEDK